MSPAFEQFAARAAPALFVLLWSTGFIGTRYVLNHAEPMTYLFVRMVLAGSLMAGIVAIWRPRWPNRMEMLHSVIAGVLVHAIYLGGTSVAIAHSVPAGLSALIPGLQPILTSTLASRWLGERVTPLQWLGLLLGVAGTIMVLNNRSMSGDIAWGFLASGVSLVSITVGTLYQKRYCSQIDWRSGNLIQFIASAALLAVGAYAFETRAVDWTAEFIAALLWLTVVLSIGSIGLLYWLIRRSAATQFASLFYLVPATTSLMAFILFDERLGLVAIIGMVLCATAVVVVNRGAKAPASPPSVD